MTGPSEISQPQIFLGLIFDEVNQVHFDGFLDAPLLRWNSRLRSSAGRFFPGRRRFWQELPPAIEVASYLMTEINARELIADTLSHEMIHYWLWVRKRPYGHTPEFHEKMKKMGVSRYNPVPRTRPYRYVYRCISCLSEYFSRKKLGPLACAACCKKYTGSRYDARYKLELHRALNPENSALT